MNNVLISKPSLVGAFKRYRLDVPSYAKDVLRFTPTDQQGDAFKALVGDNDIAIRSGHGTGKSAFLAVSILWFLDCYPKSIVPCTANTQAQIRHILWRELRKWNDKKPHDLKGRFVFHSDRLCHYKNPEDWMAISVNWSKGNINAFAGYHNDPILRVVDEAFGVPTEVFEAAEGSQTSRNAKMIMVGNPTTNTGYAYNAFHKNRASFECLHFSSAASPLVTDTYVQKIINRFGKDSNVYNVRVLGEFPTQEGNKVYSTIEIDNSYNSFSARSGLVVGVDPAREGADTSEIVFNYQGAITKIVTINKCNGPELADAVIREIKVEIVDRGVNFVLGTNGVSTIYPEKKVLINIDSIGIGASPFDILKHVKGMNVEGINVANVAEKANEYSNLKAELYFQLKEMMRDNEISFNLLDRDFDDLRAEMLSVPYEFRTSVGKNGDLLAIVSKDKLKKEGIESPNKLEAILMSIAKPKLNLTDAMSSWSRGNEQIPGIT